MGTIPIFDSDDDLSDLVASDSESDERGESSGETSDTSTDVDFSGTDQSLLQ